MSLDVLHLSLMEENKRLKRRLWVAENRGRPITDVKLNSPPQTNSFSVAAIIGETNALGFIDPNIGNMKRVSQNLNKAAELTVDYSGVSEDLNLLLRQSDHSSDTSACQTESSGSISKPLLKQFDVLRFILDKLYIGIAILDGNGRVVIINEAVKNIAKETHAYQITSDNRFKIGGLTLFDKYSNSNQSQIDVDLSDYCSNEIILVKNPLHLSCLLFELMPIGKLCDDFKDTELGTLVFISDPDRSQLVSADGVKRLFSLTPTEGEITHLLANGRTLKQIAQSRRTTVSTVRKQLKDIFSKTSSKSQLDLVRLAIGLTAPISRD
jgi:DNA-binding CsgD family transcriptional regulator